MSTKKVNPQKASLVSELKDLVSQSKSVAVVDYRGLKVSQITDLRKAIRKAGGQMIVAKNTLFKLASGFSDLHLDGTSAFVFSLSDEVSAIKAISDYAKKNQLPTFKLGILDDKLLTADEVVQLSALPDKKTLIAKTVGGLQAPLFKLVYGLNWNVTKLVRTLDAVRQSKSN